MRWLLDLLYPARCVACAQMGAWWCAECRSAVERLTATDMVFASPYPFSGVFVTGFYHSPPLRRFISALKYEGLTAATEEVEAYLRDVRRPFPWSAEASLAIVPMPLADGRERERGFNQAAWIAARMQRAWRLPGTMRTDVLCRRKTLSAQAELAHNAALRSANIQGAFQAVARVTTPVLLVDDVVTTGSTAAEAAEALRHAGAPRVYVAALAVGK